MPALVHLTRLGYEYFGKITENMSGTVFDPNTNILLEVFKKQFCKLNPGREKDFDQTLQEIRQQLDYDDLGRAFYKRLLARNPRLVDFDNIANNVFHCTAEFTCKNGADEFRPDITLFVNGLPLVYIEVKKPNNKEGIVAERNREYNARFPNKKFRRFNNITQFMIFSNNMEYDTMGGIVPLQGAFYCTNARKVSPFNCFREENPANWEVAPYHRDYAYLSIDKDIERKILMDFNCPVLHNAPEYKTNLRAESPTNRILTSMCSPERLLYIIRYALAYVKKEKEREDGTIDVTDEKHIMRYQQLFASMAITRKLSEGVKSGIIWHTQGSGKTALAYYLSNILTDYYSARNQVPRFYFIVDRIDLMDQAKLEFEARGLKVVTAATRAELMEQFRQNQALVGDTGQKEITVVNIQRFAEDTERVVLPAYATNLQRVFIIDEAHRGYRPQGCFLANLFGADPNAIKLALTGTPLIGQERKSCDVFGDYIHTYYYDKSIQDGYTLKILREEIETSYKKKLEEVYDKLDVLVQKKELRKSDIIEHDTYVKTLTKYIIDDLVTFRNLQGDKSLAGMVICETSAQARKMFAWFDKVQSEINENSSEKIHLKAALILHDEGDSEERKQKVVDFKENGTIDILIVFNMLLTGFDAHRLKRLYFGRKLKDHSLLQAITRVNRPYKGRTQFPLRYGYIIDFADIKQNFTDTNEAYLKELRRFNDPAEVGEGNETDTFEQVLESPEEIVKRMQEIREILFNYTTENVEEFSSEISTLEDKKELLSLRTALVAAKEMANIVRTFGSEDLKTTFATLDLPKIPAMLKEVSHRIDLINLKEKFSPSEETKQAITDAMADIQFDFHCISKEELKMISGGVELEDKYRSTVRAFTGNVDQDDPEYITLRELFMQRFREKGFKVETIAQFNEATKAMDDILARLAELKKKNDNLLKKYNGDAKFARVHKRIQEENNARNGKKPPETPIISVSDFAIHQTLFKIKETIDGQVYDRNDILKKDAYFEQTVMSLITQGMNELNITSERKDRAFIQSRIASQYLQQYHDTYVNAM